MCASGTYLFNAKEPLALTPNIHPLHSDWFKRLGTRHIYLGPIYTIRLDNIR